MLRMSTFSLEIHRRRLLCCPIHRLMHKQLFVMLQLELAHQYPALTNPEESNIRLPLNNEDTVICISLAKSFRLGG